MEYILDCESGCPRVEPTKGTCGQEQQRPDCADTGVDCGAGSRNRQEPSGTVMSVSTGRKKSHVFTVYCDVCLHLSKRTVSEESKSRCKTMGR